MLLVAVLAAGCHSSPASGDPTRPATAAAPPSNARRARLPGDSTSGREAAPVRVAVLVYPGVELLDFSGPAEVFSNVPGARVYLVSTSNKSLATNGNIVHLTADYTLANAPQPDILVVPGAPQEVVTGVYRNPAALAWVKQAAQGSQLTMSVCTGAFILSEAGLTHHKSVTTHWGAVDSLQRFDPQATVLKDKRFVEDGKLLTTAGVSAGIDGALRVVAELRGPDEARSVARMMQYDKWQPAQGLVIGHSGIRPPAPLAATVARDPVCQMAVPTPDAPTLAYRGVTYHFCSAICRENFRRHPAQYAPQ
jgi:putative intracellular protease/amidase/YHS domain-containing protein